MRLKATVLMISHLLAGRHTQERTPHWQVQHLLRVGGRFGPSMSVTAEINIVIPFERCGNISGFLLTRIHSHIFTAVNECVNWSPFKFRRGEIDPSSGTMSPFEVDLTISKIVVVLNIQKLTVLLIQVPFLFMCSAMRFKWRILCNLSDFCFCQTVKTLISLNRNLWKVSALNSILVSSAYLSKSL